MKQVHEQQSKSHDSKHNNRPCLLGINSGSGLGINALNPSSPMGLLHATNGETETQRGSSLLEITSCNAMPLRLKLAANLRPYLVLPGAGMWAMEALSRDSGHRNAA